MMDYIQYFIEHFQRILTATGEHLMLTCIAMITAIALAVPLGIILSRHPKAAKSVFAVVNTIQTIPSLALLGFMIPLFGLGNVPAVIALFLYAILPILRNTVAGIESVSKSLIEVAQGLGMTSRQILLKVELPLALSTIMTGIRTATVIIIGWATLAAYVGGGGLGRLIMAGMAMGRIKMIVAGAVPAILLALLVDYILGSIEQSMTIPVSKIE